MTIHISSELLKAAKLSEEEVLVELASHLFNIGRLGLHEAAQMANKSRADFEDELHERHIPIHRLEVSDLQEDLHSIEHFRRQGR